MKKHRFLIITMIMLLLNTIPVMANDSYDNYTPFYTYNWDNVNNAMEFGVWGGNGNLQGYKPETGDDINIRHKMVMYCANGNVNLQITYASCFTTPGNGWDYNFTIGNNNAKFTVTFEDNKGLDYTYKEPGDYSVEIRHGDGAISGQPVKGATGHIIVNENQLNNVQEITIPLSELKNQNPNIDISNAISIEFFTPNLMTEAIRTDAYYEENIDEIIQDNTLAAEDVAETLPNDENSQEQPVDNPEEQQPVDNPEEQQPVDNPEEQQPTDQQIEEEQPETNEYINDKYWIIACDFMGDAKVAYENGDTNLGHQKIYCGTAENTVIYLDNGVPYDMAHIKRGSGAKDKKCILFTDGTYTEQRDISTVKLGDYLYWETINGNKVWHHSGQLQRCEDSDVHYNIPFNIAVQSLIDGTGPINNDGNFTFIVKECDSKGNVLSNALTLEMSTSNPDNGLSFNIDLDNARLIPTEVDGNYIHCFRVEEKYINGDTNYLYDRSQYIVKVTVSNNNDNWQISNVEKYKFDQNLESNSDGNSIGHKNLDSSDSYETYTSDTLLFDNKRTLEVIVHYIEDDSVDDGTLLNQYIDIIDNKKVLIQEISTKPIKGEEENPFNPTDHWGLADESTDPPTIDNGKWLDVPAQWEYNYDNTDEATKWGVWGGNGHLEGYVTDHMDDNNVRHHMGIYCDGKNVHLFIQYASCFSNPGNGNDYNFYLDDIGAKFRVTYTDGSDLSYTYKVPGTYTLSITHGDGAISGEEVQGAYGKIIVNEDQLNNIQEIVIPLSEMKRQNDSINLDTFSMIEFFTPNLMYRRISCAGASSGPIPFAIGSILTFGLALVKRRFIF